MNSTEVFEALMKEASRLHHISVADLEDESIEVRIAYKSAMMTDKFTPRGAVVFKGDAETVFNDAKEYLIGVPPLNPHDHRRN